MDRIDPDSLELFVRYLRTHGQHLTGPRRRIAAAALAQADHFDAQTLWAQLRDRGARVGAATVYRTLELLIEAGLVRRLSDEKAAQYEVIYARVPHEHLRCRACGSWQEFSSARLEEELAEVAERWGFLLEGRHVQLVGLCRSCQRQRRRQRRRKGSPSPPTPAPEGSR